MGISIAIEGSEGAGKSVLHKLTEILFKETTDFSVLATREPGGTKLGSMVRTILKGDDFQDMHAISNVLLYSTARAELFFKKEVPFLEEHPRGILLKDRSWLSTVCLQTVDGAGLEYIDLVQQPFKEIPHKFAIIDIPVLETVVRMESVSRYSSDREIDWRDKQTQENLGKIRENYLSYAIKNRDKCIVLDCFDDPWKKAATIKYESIKLLMSKEGLVLDEAQLGIFIDEARQLGTTYASKEGGTFGTFDIAEYREQVEETRQKLGYPNREELQAGMHEEWRAMGIEGAGVGIERK